MKYSDVMGGWGYIPPRKFSAFTPHNVVSESVLGHLE